MSENVADFENMMSLDQPIKSTTLSRWERKQQQQAQSLLSDRFIPNRAGMDQSFSQGSSFEDDKEKDAGSEPGDKSEYQKMLNATATDAKGETANARVLAFKNKAPAPKDGYQSSLKVLYSQQTSKRTESAKPTRHIPSAPIRILDAPDMLDDYCKYRLCSIAFFCFS
jgi:cell division cycle protein 20 (cofactor of APC complex)